MNSGPEETDKAWQIFLLSTLIFIESSDQNLHFELSNAV